MFGNIPDKRDSSKRGASWLGISLFKSLRTLLVILFGLTALWILREEMLESLINFVRIIKHASKFAGERKTKAFIWRFIEYSIFSAMVEN